MVALSRLRHEFDRHLSAVALDDQRDRPADLSAQVRLEVTRLAEGASVRRDHMVIGLKSSPRGRTIWIDILDAKPLLALAGLFKFRANRVLIRSLLARLLDSLLGRFLTGLLDCLSRRLSVFLNLSGRRAGRVILRRGVGLSLCNTHRHGCDCNEQHATRGRTPPATKVRHVLLLTFRKTEIETNSAFVFHERHENLGKRYAVSAESWYAAVGAYQRSALKVCPRGFY